MQQDLNFIVFSICFFWLLLCFHGIVTVYDSLDTPLTQQSFLAISRLMALRQPPDRIEWAPVQRQGRTKLCGLFSIAFLLELVFGFAPEQANFNYGRMRESVQRMLEEQFVFRIEQSGRTTRRSPRWRAENWKGAADKFEIPEALNKNEETTPDRPNGEGTQLPSTTQIPVLEDTSEPNPMDSLVDVHLPTEFLESLKE